MNATATVAQLRHVLGDHFGKAEAAAALRHLRQSGVIAPGRSGHAGCRSAPIDAHQAAHAVLLLTFRSPAAIPVGFHDALTDRIERGHRVSVRHQLVVGADVVGDVVALFRQHRAEAA